MRLHQRLFPLIAFVATFSSAIAEEPFDFNSTPGKLPKQVVPESYAIKIAPNLTNRTFSGSETVKLKVNEPVRELVLNVNEIKITNTSLDRQQIDKTSCVIEPNEQLLRIRLPNELSTGSHQLALEFTGKINEAGQGLYAASYQDKESGTRKTMLGTQFEPTDARRLFP
jgi:aminopeptidase N